MITIVNGRLITRNPSETGLLIINGRLFIWDEEAVGGPAIKSVNDILWANIKSINGIVQSSIKSINGVT
ncbi:MAG: hypothetical protein ACTSXY_15120 [Promethearchaeota archaeon]